MSSEVNEFQPSSSGSHSKQSRPVINRHAAFPSLPITCSPRTSPEFRKSLDRQQQERINYRINHGSSSFSEIDRKVCSSRESLRRSLDSISARNVLYLNHNLAAHTNSHHANSHINRYNTPKASNRLKISDLYAQQLSSTQQNKTSSIDSRNARLDAAKDLEIHFSSSPRYSAPMRRCSSVGTVSPALPLSCDRSKLLRSSLSSVRELQSNDMHHPEIPPQRRNSSQNLSSLDNTDNQGACNDRKRVNLMRSSSGDARKFDLDKSQTTPPAPWRKSSQDSPSFDNENRQFLLYERNRINQLRHSFSTVVEDAKNNHQKLYNITPPSSPSQKRFSQVSSSFNGVSFKSSISEILHSNGDNMPPIQSSPRYHLHRRETFHTLPTRQSLRVASTINSTESVSPIVSNPNSMNYNRGNSLPSGERSSCSFSLDSNQSSRHKAQSELNVPGHHSIIIEEVRRDSSYDKQQSMNAQNDLLMENDNGPPDPCSESFSDSNTRNRENSNFTAEKSRRNGDAILYKVISSLWCILPKVEPLPCKTFISLSIWCALPPIAFIAFFTEMGIGEQVYYSVAREMGQYANGLAGSLALFIFILYMLDAESWKSNIGLFFFDLSAIVIVAGVVLLVLLIADTFPYGMTCLFTLFNPLWLLSVKLICYSNVNTRTYLSWLSTPLLFMSFVTGLSWTVWVFSDAKNEWNEIARIESASRSECFPDYSSYPHCRKEEGSEDPCFYVEKTHDREYVVFPDHCSQSCTEIYDGCLNGFILWVGPVLICMTMLFLSFFCTFLRSERTDEKDVLNFGKVWIFLLFVMWVSASLSGTAAGITSALVALTLASFVGSAAFLTVSFSKKQQNQNATAVMQSFCEKYAKHLDAVRGLFIVTCSPILVIYCGLSMVNQLVRRTGIFPCSKPAVDDDYQVHLFTPRTKKQLEVIRSWDRTKVYTYAVYWGIAFMVLEVFVTKLTVVFLSWLIQQTSDFGLLNVTLIMCAAGTFLFLLPPVPGVPVYLTLGIVLPAQGHELLGWIGSISYSVAISLALKLFTGVLQQKVIGEYLSGYVQIRQFVGINSSLMRALRLILVAKGFSVPKVAILIGGPDWPTSVLCGIMKISVVQIMIGTTPVVFLIIPTCVTGAFLYMASLETEGIPLYPWARTMSTIVASFTAMVQFGSMIAAAYYLEHTASTCTEDIEAIPIDEEVRHADEEALQMQKCFKDSTQWSVLPFCPKLLLRLSLACVTISSYMVQLFSSKCFTAYSLTDTIDENLNGSVLNLFVPMGWVAISLFSASCLFLFLFQQWGKRKAKQCVNERVTKCNSTEHCERNSSGINQSIQPFDEDSEWSADPPGVLPDRGIST